MYGTMRGRDIRVYGTMRGRAMRLYGIMGVGHECTCIMRERAMRVSCTMG